MPKVGFLYFKTCNLAGLVTNIALAIFKLLAGIFGFSYAMIADAIHSFSDRFTTGTVYVALRIAERLPDEKHPHGHANAETIATLPVAFIMLTTGSTSAFLLATSLPINISKRQPRLPWHQLSLQ
jgi:divalent metal cation (Fe/Co/Zn/Cd) transporter